MEKFKKFELNHSQMKNVTGGLWGCSCNNGIGIWTANYSNPGQALYAVYIYCSGLGSCREM
jgi:natural product precursor